MRRLSICHKMICVITFPENLIKTWKSPWNTKLLSASIQAMTISKVLISLTICVAFSAALVVKTNVDDLVAVVQVKFQHFYRKFQFILPSEHCDSNTCKGEIFCSGV